jgi:hypothetical protein
VQLEPISSSRVFALTEVEPRPFSDSSTIHSWSPGRNVCDWTLFELMLEYVPLPNLGLSPKKTLTVCEQDERIVTETELGAAGSDEDDAEAGVPGIDESFDEVDGSPPELPPELAYDGLPPPAPDWGGMMQAVEPRTRARVARVRMVVRAASMQPVAGNRQPKIELCVPQRFR